MLCIFELNDQVHCFVISNKRIQVNFRKLGFVLVVVYCQKKNDKEKVEKSK